jgi:hypothetical protein
MSRSKQHGWFRFGPASYAVGLALIVSAAIFNVSLDKLPPKHLYSLPDFLVDPYDRAGPLGLTLCLAGFGMLLVMLGFLGTLRQNSTQSSSVEQVSDSVADAATSSPQGGTTRSSSMVLATQKYVGKRPFEKARSAVASDPPTAAES